jgi:hypothetical protein
MKNEPPPYIRRMPPPCGPRIGCLALLAALAIYPLSGLLMFAIIAILYCIFR